MPAKVPATVRDPVAALILVLAEALGRVIDEATANPDAAELKGDGAVRRLLDRLHLDKPITPEALGEFARRLELNPFGLELKAGDDEDLVELKATIAEVEGQRDEVAERLATVAQSATQLAAMIGDAADLAALLERTAKAAQ